MLFLKKKSKMVIPFYIRILFNLRGYDLLISDPHRVRQRVRWRKQFLHCRLFLSLSAMWVWDYRLVWDVWNSTTYKKYHFPSEWTLSLTRPSYFSLHCSTICTQACLSQRKSICNHVEHVSFWELSDWNQTAAEFVAGYGLLPNSTEGLKEHVGRGSPQHGMQQALAAVRRDHSIMIRRHVNRLASMIVSGRTSGMLPKAEKDRIFAANHFYGPSLQLPGFQVQISYERNPASLRRLGDEIRERESVVWTDTNQETR